MSQKILNDGDSGLSFRNKLNENFTELYELAEIMSAWYSTIQHIQTMTTTPSALVYLDDLSYEKGIVYDKLTGLFEVTKAGGYGLNVAFGASWATGIEVYFSIWVDGVQRGNSLPRTGEGAPKEITISIPTFINIPANGTLEIRAHVDAGVTDVTFNFGTTMLDLKFYT